MEINNIFNDEIKMIPKLSDKGKRFRGVVKSIQPYGAFIRTDSGFDGLLYIEDISVARIKSPEERLKVGQKIDVVIKDVDELKNRVFFSHKEILGTWDENIEGLEEKEIVTGIVRETEKNKKGIFIEIKPNLVGMAEYKDGLEYGQKVNVYVKKIIKDKKKIKLIIKGGL